MSPFEPKYDVPLWRKVYDHAVTMEVDELLDWQQLKRLVKYDMSLPGASRSPVLVATKHLLRDKQRRLASVRGKGYRIVHASEHEQLALAGRRSARRKLAKARDDATYADRNQLDVAQRQAIDSLANTLSVQAAMLRRHEVRLDEQQTQIKDTQAQQQAQADELARMRAALKLAGIEVPERRVVKGETS